MTTKLKLKLIRMTFLNLYWSLKSESYALKMLADTSVGFYLRQTDLALYNTHLNEYINTDALD